MLKIIFKGFVEIFAYVLLIVMRIISIIWLVVGTTIHKIEKIFRLKKCLEEYTTKVEKDFQAESNFMLYGKKN